ncbi:hypothetical protein CVT25_014374, partial [Psilocybe cyanescens]
EAIKASHREFVDREHQRSTGQSSSTADIAGSDDEAMVMDLPADMTSDFTEHQRSAGQSSSTADIAGSDDEAMVMDSPADMTSDFTNGAINMLCTDADSVVGNLSASAPVASALEPPVMPTPIRRAFKDVVPSRPTTNMLGSSTKFLEDTMKFKVT